MKQTDSSIVNISTIYRKTNIWEDSYAATLGLSAAQIPVIASICRNHGISQNDLCACLNMDKGTVAKTIARLEKDGFITRQKNMKDKRAYYIIPTDKAQSVYPVIVEKGIAWFHSLTNGMSAKEIERFEFLLEIAARNATAITCKLP